MKNFLPYKESIAIKEIGFDEPCLGAWTNIDKKPEFSYNKKPTKYSKMFTKKSPHCVAPLYQEVFDWFTEQGLFSYVDRTYTNGKYEYEFHIEGNSGLFGFETKRLAEQACIRSLISILKMDKNYMKKLIRDNKLNELGI